MMLIFLASCTKESSDNSLHMYDPSELNEIQENAVNVVAQYAEDNISSVKNGIIDKDDFYDGLLDHLAQYLSDATDGLALTSFKGGVPYDVCHTVLKTQRDSLSNINIAEDTVGGAFRQPNAYEEFLSDAYHEIRDDHIELRHQGLDAGHDSQHSSLLALAYNTLNSDEANHIAAKIHPVLQVHNMFESGAWEDLKLLYSADDDKLFSCFVAAVAAMTLVEGLTATAAVAGTAASVSTIVKNSSKNSWGLPSTTTDWEHIHINNVFAACSSLLDLVENHLDTE